MRMGWFHRGICGLGLALLAFVSLGVQARAQVTQAYDGTGSTYGPEMFDAKDDAKAQAETAADERERQKLIDDVAAGKLYALAPLAGKLQYGDENHAPDEAGALDLYEKAADAGNAVGLGHMCIAYLLGEGRPRDTTKGLGYCDRLTDSSPTVLFARGYAALEGLSGPVDKAAGMTFLTKAVDGGIGAAADILGRDAQAAGKAEEARAWFRRGAYRGSVDALDDMAKMAEVGEGGPQDIAEAYWLYVNAARHANAHAQSWVAAHPDMAPLRRIVLENGKTFTAITETYTDRKGKPQTAALDTNAILNDLVGYWPPRAARDHVGGVAIIDCYVNAEHRVDVCWLRMENPPGYEFGRIVEGFYEGQLTVADTDAVGEPTAQRVFVSGIEWQKPW